MRPFSSRFEAGQLLASKLSDYQNHPEVLILALPRGGVPVAYEIAKELNLPLDVFLVRKLGVPGEDELAMGAIGSGGVRVLNRDVLRERRVSEAAIEAVTIKEQKELKRREALYRLGRPPLTLKNRTLILVDDGAATGATMLAAAQTAGSQNPSRIVVAVPVASTEAYDSLNGKVDEIVCQVVTPALEAVGLWYENFTQLTDEEVAELLDRARLIKQSTENL
jgi:putative phosphoribosyl transferase